MQGSSFRTFVRIANRINREVAEMPARILILGAGPIGTSFAAVFSDAGACVTLCDPDTARLEHSPKAISEHRNAIETAKLSMDGPPSEVTLISDFGDVGEDLDLVIECGPEDVETKQGIFADLHARTASDTILATASSAITISKIIPDPAKQARCIVAHPVNPPSILRLIELCPAPGTNPSTTERASELFRSAGFSPVVLGHEVEGFLLNRLQSAVLREAYRLVDEGAADVDAIDTVMRLGLGPRWALSGPFETAELNTIGGIKGHAARMGPAYKRIGEDRGETVDWHPDLVARVARERDALRGDTTVEQRRIWRAHAVARLIAARDALAGEPNDEE
ncbi:MAG: 3-hydroxyacyl-CoA dehydrogenase [Alphaproteobacteria bacterium]|nr:3-hydroxyacyl-CoA dehydrogenase [Alphaproteobacteria bacterium]